MSASGRHSSMVMAADFRSAAGSRSMRRLAALALFALLAAIPAAWSKPARIVSMNLCADELLIRLADPDRIRSVTWMAHSEEGSNVSAAARAFPANRSEEH